MNDWIQGAITDEAVDLASGHNKPQKLNSCMLLRARKVYLFIMEVSDYSGF